MANEDAGAAQLREALATAELQLQEARSELGRLVRITERDLGRQRAEVDAANSARDSLGERVERYRESMAALVKTMRDSDLLPREVIGSWLVQSGVFDPEFYALANQDVADAGLEPADHFLDYGLDEGRGFNDAFSDWK